MKLMWPPSEHGVPQYIKKEEGECTNFYVNGEWLTSDVTEERIDQYEKALKGEANLPEIGMLPHILNLVTSHA